MSHKAVEASFRHLFFRTWKKEFEEEDAGNEGTFGGVGGDKIWFTWKMLDRLISNEFLYF